MTKLEKRVMVEECRRSGLVATEWCKLKGINYRSYIDWASLVNKEDRKAPMNPIQWADVTEVTKTQDRDRTECKLKCGKWTITVEPGFNATMLAEVVKVVDAIC